MQKESSHNTSDGVFARAQKCAQVILNQTSQRPKVGFILGSGLGAFADSMEGGQSFPYAELPGFHSPSVPGHSGRLIVGEIGGVDVLVMSGRCHAYEGYSMEEVTFPVRVMHCMGIETLVVTNSAGGITATFSEGDLMVLTDHINLTGTNPLIGPNIEEFGPRFPDMTYGYDPALRETLLGVAQDLGVTLQKGVYVGLMGPSYETPAEIRMLRVLGGDAVGMSTVSESIIANHCGMKVLGISCISNMAAGMSEERLSHEDVKHAASKARDVFVSLLRGFIATFAA